MKKLFCYIALGVAFFAIGSQQPTPIRESFGEGQWPQKPQHAEPQPIRHSFGHDSPYSGFYGPGRKELDEQWLQQGSASGVASKAKKNKPSGT